MSEEITAAKRELLKQLKDTRDKVGTAQAYKILAEAEAVESQTASNEKNAAMLLEANTKQAALELRRMEQQVNATSPLKV